MRSKLFSLATVALCSGVATADIYNDSVGDIGVPNNNLDLITVTLTNDATNLYASITANADLVGTDWGKYLFMFDTSAAGGLNDNPWVRAIDTNGRFNEVFVGSWIDGGGGAQIWTNNNVAWSQASQIGVNLSQAAAGIISYTFPLADMGLTASGQTIFFDVMSTGGGNGDPGIDHLSRADLATPGWGTTSVAGTYRAYTLVPAPSGLGLLAAGGLFMARRRRR